MWFVYILECEDGLLYTGITNNLERRFKEHSQGQGGHYTHCTKPKKMLFWERHEKRVAAQEREIQIKKWSRAKKLALIRKDFRMLRR